MEMYKKYRPRTLDRVVGNRETVDSLKNMLERKTLPHSILFHGPSGCGKTTLMRIVASMLGVSSMDLREINSSSFRGIDTIRDIERTLRLPPAAGPVRVYLMDEVHKMSNDAQNAALKMTEDTPPHVYFFWGTTDPDKLIKAVRTRFCSMPVRDLTYKEMELVIDRVCRKEKIVLTPKVKDSLVASAGGSARVALVTLERMAGLTPEQQEGFIIARIAEENKAIDLCRALISGKSWKAVADILSKITEEPESVRHAVLGYARSVLLKENNFTAYNIIVAFSNNFYDSKAAGLAAACYEVTHPPK